MGHVEAQRNNITAASRKRNKKGTNGKRQKSMDKVKELSGFSLNEYVNSFTGGEVDPDVIETKAARYGWKVTG